MEAHIEDSPSEDTKASLLTYSRMSTSEANSAYLSRKDQILKLLKSRMTQNSPSASLISKSSKRTNSSSTLRFKVDFSKTSQHQTSLKMSSPLKNQLKNSLSSTSVIKPKYSTSEPLYQRTFQWKANSKKKNTERKLEREANELKQCSFEPKLNKNTSRIQSADIYERTTSWKNTNAERSKLMKEWREKRGEKECTFRPEIINTKEGTGEISDRSQAWQEKVFNKVRMLRDENEIIQKFYPSVRKVSKKKNALAGKIDQFLIKLDDVASKIDQSLVESAEKKTLFN